VTKTVQTECRRACSYAEVQPVFAVAFSKCGCKGTAFFLNEQIFLGKNALFAYFCVILGRC